MKTVKLSKEANYGNWVPANMMRLLWGISGGLLIAVIALYWTVNIHGHLYLRSIG